MSCNHLNYIGVPSCLTIGPDGNLYICSYDTNQILRYDGTSGAFLDVYIDSSELELPVSIQFLSQPFDELPFSGDHDSDNDGVNNNVDAFPLDASRTDAPEEPIEVDSSSSSGGSVTWYNLLFLTVVVILSLVRTSKSDFRREFTTT